MTLAQEIDLAQDTQSEITFPPSDLYSDEPPMETYLHLQQMMLLLNCLEWWWRDRQDFFVAGNLTVYYSLRQRKSEDFRGLEFAGFHLLDGKYEVIPPNPQGLLWSHQLELNLGIYQGKLRFLTAEGTLVPTPEEVADTERHQKEIAQQKADRLVAKLRELGIDPDGI